jgi:hypothetical protein
VSVAGAAQDVRIYVSDTNGTCFTTQPNKAACDPGERADVGIRTDDTVSWDFTGSTNTAAARLQRGPPLGRSTPAPGHASVKDAEKPRLANASAKRVSAGARLRFWLSEPATVHVSAARKASKRVLSSTIVQAPAGTRGLTLRTKALRRKGTYTVTFAPVDAMGNTGVTVKRNLRVK